VGFDDQWIAVRTEHFRLLSNASERSTSKIGARLEQMQQVLALAFNRDAVTALPAHIYVFKDEASFAPFKIGANGRPDSIVGYHVGTPSAHYIAIDASAGDRPFRTIYHEFVHYFVSNTMPFIPLWLNEGLAEYFSTIKVKGTQVDVGLPIEDHRYWLAQYDLIPFNEVFKIDHSSPEYQEGARRGTFYAQSWALAHYLMNHPERKRLNKLLAELQQGASADDAFKTAYALDLVALEKEIETGYTKELGLRYVEWQLDSDVKAGKTVTEPVRRADVLFHLGDLLAHNHPIQFEAAEKYLRAALASDSTRAAAHADLGLIRHEQERYSEAKSFFERAIAIAPDDAAIRLAYGSCLSQEFFVPGKKRLTAKETPPVLLQAREQLRHAIQLDSLSVEDELGFGRTFLLDRGQVVEGVSALTYVVNEEPWRLDAVVDLIVVTAHSGNRQAARSLLERTLLPRANDKLIHYAEVAIADEDVRAAEDLYDQERYSEAQELLRQTVAQTRDDKVRSRVEARLAELERASPPTSSKK
jgi:tetratricopeptide (TPR) repeat protein